MKFRNVIFDLDGTLLDTSAGIIESVLYTVGKMNLKPLSEPELRSFIGPPLRRSFKEICGCAEDEASEAVRVFRAFYQAGAVLHASPYDGMEKLCRTLSEAGVRTGAATNKPERFASALIVNFGLDRYIHPVFGADENGTFSKADLVRMCMEEMGGTPSDTVLIGDTDNDAAGAEEAGVPFIAVTYGFGYRCAADVSGHPCVGAADSPMDILRILTENGPERRCFSA